MRSKWINLTLGAIAWLIFFMACGYGGYIESPEPTATSVQSPLATATQLPNALLTPQATSAPEAEATMVSTECFGTFQDKNMNAPLCTKDQKQALLLQPTECIKIDTSAEVEIFYIRSDKEEDHGPPKGNEFCNETGFVITDIWAVPRWD